MFTDLALGYEPFSQDYAEQREILSQPVIKDLEGAAERTNTAIQNVYERTVIKTVRKAIEQKKPWTQIGRMYLKILRTCKSAEAKYLITDILEGISDHRSLDEKWIEIDGEWMEADPYTGEAYAVTEELAEKLKANLKADWNEIAAEVQEDVDRYMMDYEGKDPVDFLIETIWKINGITNEPLVKVEPTIIVRHSDSFNARLVEEYVELDPEELKLAYAANNYVSWDEYLDSDPTEALFDDRGMSTTWYTQQQEETTHIDTQILSDLRTEIKKEMKVARQLLRKYKGDDGDFIELVRLAMKMNKAEDEAEAMSLLFDAADNNASIIALAKEMRKRKGQITAKGKAWHISSQIRSLIEKLNELAHEYPPQYIAVIYLSLREMGYLSEKSAEAIKLPDWGDVSKLLFMYENELLDTIIDMQDGIWLNETDYQQIEMFDTQTSNLAAATLSDDPKASRETTRVFNEAIQNAILDGATPQEANEAGKTAHINWVCSQYPVLGEVKAKMEAAGKPEKWARAAIYNAGYIKGLHPNGITVQTLLYGENKFIEKKWLKNNAKMGQIKVNPDTPQEWKVKIADHLRQWGWSNNDLALLKA